MEINPEPAFLKPIVPEKQEINQPEPPAFLKPLVPEKQEPLTFSFNKKQEEEKPNVFENKSSSSLFAKKEDSSSFSKGSNYF